MKDYPELLASLLEMEFGKTPERAKELVKTHTDIVIWGIMEGVSSLRAAAMLLDDKDHTTP